MAIKKITLKKRVGSNYDVLYPEIKRADVLKSDGTAVSTFGASVLNAQPAVGEAGFAVTDSNEFTSYSAAEVRSEFEIAKSDHTHTISNVTGLQTALDAKVPLVTGKIPEQYFPAVNAESMTFVGTTSGGTTSATAITLSGAFTWNLQSAFLPSLLDGNGDPKPNLLGNYVIVTGSGGYFKNNTPETVSGITYNLIFRQLNTVTKNFEEVDDAQPTNNEVAVLLEPGDRIVFTDMVEVSATEYNLLFDVLNMNYSYGGANIKGAARLSDATTLGGMLTTTSAADVVDEKVMRDAMKDIVYEEDFTATFTVTQSSVIRYSTSNPTSTDAASVGDRWLNITTGNVYECTNAAPPNYTWTQNASIPGFAVSSLDPATYYVFNSIPFVSAPGNLTQGTMQQLAPLSNDLVFSI